jgi:glycosyltransferase involved in cell wall biosynthesis
LSKKNSYDLVIEDLNKIPFFGKFYIREKRIAILHHLFGKVVFMETNPIFASYVYIYEKLIPKFYRDIPIITVSNSTKDDLVSRRIPKKNIEVIHNGVNLKHFNIKKDLYENPTIVALGRLMRYKRMDILIETIPEIRKAIPNIRVLVIGSGEHLSYLKTLAKNKKVEDVIDFLGFISENEKREVLSRSWVSVNTSPKEGWGLTSIEAQASETPSIVPDSPGLIETVKNGKTGYIYPFGDKKTLASYIIDLLKDKEKVITMGEEARRWASKFSWDNSAKKMKNFIENII